jgi:hypothetical protein
MSAIGNWYCEIFIEFTPQPALPVIRLSRKIRGTPRTQHGAGGAVICKSVRNSMRQCRMKVKMYFALASMLAMIGCARETDSTKTTEFIVRVDSLNHTPFAATGDTISIKLYGTIGGDGCHSFSRFEHNQQPLQLDLTVWGQRSASEVCPAVMVYLNGREFRSVVTQQGWYKINIHQPDGGTLKDSLVIK